MSEPFSRSFAYHGSIDSFRAVMTNLSRAYRAKYGSSEMWIREWPPSFHKDPRNSIWLVRDYHRLACATITAVETKSDTTHVNLQDGYDAFNVALVNSVGSRFEELARHLIAHWEPSSVAPESTASLDALDWQIIEAVHMLQGRGYDTTDEAVAQSIQPNPRTNLSYHRVTINRHRNKLRDKGFEL